MKPGLGRQLQGRRILITGGGTGIGAATARACAAAGMQVMLSGRRVEPLERVVGEIKSAGGEASLRVRDVAAAGASERLLDAMDEDFGGIDVVFANAGYGIEKPVLEATPEEIRRIFDVNLVAAIDLMRVTGLRLREENRPGHLLGCASILGKFTMPGYGLYSSTKAALTHVCRSMRCELYDDGIAVSSVHPVTTRTEFFDVAKKESGEGHGPVVKDGVPTHAPRIFVQSADVVARAVVKCLRRPRAEVWTSSVGRLSAGIFELVPPVYELVLRSEMRRKRREGASER
ncbi:MAG: SDR family NAD(P)-dependent oxidoreductase [Planctomycetota bacterium]|nr:SDR family NAD(P)-dependent oxidoreductase [Planctomycetota bacterium]